MKRWLVALLLSLIFGMVGWTIDSYIDYKMEHQNPDATFLEVFISISDGHEWCERSVVSFLCFISVMFYHFSFEKYRKRDKEMMVQKCLALDKYTTIFKNAPTAISLVDENGILIDCNSKMEELLGYDKSEIVGENFKKWIHPDFYSLGQRQLDKIINYGISSYTEYVFIKKGNININVSVNSASVKDEIGNFVHTICFLRDIGEDKKYEEAMKEVADELQHSNQELEQFAYVASHDLQEPLRVVSNYCEMLRDKCKDCSKKDEETEKWITYTIDATIRMKNLIKELLDFSRVGRKDKPFEKADINKIIKNAVNDFKVLIAETNAVIEVEDNFPVINCIEFRIGQLFHNLISNAIKFRGKKIPNINISFCEEGEHYLFCVKDNGIGISSKYFDRIFGIFKRLYSRDEYPGTGIGLALCKKIVETHNGTIWVDSHVNKGASFYFTLPKN